MVLVKSCIFCKKEFKVYPSRTIAKYCSLNCSGKFRRGKPHSQEHIEKIRNALKGKHLSLERKLKIGLANKGKIRTLATRKKMSYSHKKNPTRYWLGKTPSQATREKIAKANTGKKPTDKIRKLLSEQKRKENNPNWKGGITPVDELERVRFRQTMQKLIFERDNYQCQMCESSKDLQVDHIASWAEFKELRFDPENCRTLCAKCHYKLTYGREMPENVKTWGHNFKYLISKI